MTLVKSLMVSSTREYTKPLALHLLLLLLLPTAALSQVLVGQVVSVADGDTITILDSSKKQHKIRLYGIDTPEKGQAFGNSAKRHTLKLTSRKTAHVVVMDKDRYGRTVGVVVVEGVNVNQDLIESGYAWVYRKYCKADFCDDWLELEQKVRYSKRGLWADLKLIESWNWRKAKRTTSSKTESVTHGSSIVYHGNLRSKVFRGTDCKHYDCKNCVKSFKSKLEALNSGYRPHHEC